MSNLPPVPVRTPVIDFNGYLHPIWVDWMQKVFVRTGGAQSATNDEIYTLASQVIDETRLAGTVAGSGLTGAAGFPLAVNADGSTLEVVSDQVRVKDSGITAAKVADGVLAFAKFLSTDWTSSTGASGYQKLPSGVYIQWGITSSLGSGTTTNIALPTAFPTACRQVIAGVRDNSAIATTTTGQWGTGNYSASAFDLYNRTSSALTFNFLAVGH